MGLKVFENIMCKLLYYIKNGSIVRLFSFLLGSSEQGLYFNMISTPLENFIYHINTRS